MDEEETYDTMAINGINGQLCLPLAQGLNGGDFLPEWIMQYCGDDSFVRLNLSGLPATESKLFFLNRIEAVSHVDDAEYIRGQSISHTTLYCMQLLVFFLIQNRINGRWFFKNRDRFKVTIRNVT